MKGLVSSLLFVVAVLCHPSAFGEGFGVPDPTGPGNYQLRSMIWSPDSSTYDRYIMLGRTYDGLQFLGLIGAYRAADGGQDLGFGAGLGGGFLGSYNSPTNTRPLKHLPMGVRIFDFPYANTTGRGYDNLCTAVVETDTTNHYYIAACRAMKTDTYYNVYLVSFDKFGALRTGFGTDGIADTGWSGGATHAFVRGLAVTGTTVTVAGARGNYATSFLPYIQKFSIASGASSSTVFTLSSCGLTNPTNATAVGIVTDGTTAFIPVTDWAFNATNGNRQVWNDAYVLSSFSQDCTKVAAATYPWNTTLTTDAGNDQVFSGGGMYWSSATTVVYTGSTRSHTFVGTTPTVGEYNCMINYAATSGALATGYGKNFLANPTTATLDGVGMSLFNPVPHTLGQTRDCVLQDVAVKDGITADKHYVGGASYNGTNYDFLVGILGSQGKYLESFSWSPEGPGDDVVNKVAVFQASDTNVATGDFYALGRTANSAGFHSTSSSFAGAESLKSQNADSFIATSTVGAPTSRAEQSAVWTGTKMLVWGGLTAANTPTNTGGIYDPVSDSWVTMSTTTAPNAKTGHSAAWDGSQMIVFGGWNAGTTPAYYADARKFTFTSTDTAGTWTALNTTNMPSARAYHTGLFTGTDTNGKALTVVMGGQSAASTFLTDGGQYDSAANSWGATSATLLTARSRHTSVLPSLGRIIYSWGGTSGSGAIGSLEKYNIDTNTPTTIAGTTGSPPSNRYLHAGVTDNRNMIIWGGFDGSVYKADGAWYNFLGNSWTALNTTGAPTLRAPGYVWTGSKLLIMQGYNGTNALADSFRFDSFNGTSGTWTTATTTGAPAARYNQSIVWSGERAIEWGGQSGTTFYGASANGGASYSPGTTLLHPSRDVWATGTSAAAADTPARLGQSAVWGGKYMLVFGGMGTAGTVVTGVNVGRRYDPVANSWTVMQATGIPAARKNHTAVWTGSEMIVWGGSNDTVALQDGGRYNPATDAWTATESVTNVPSVRENHRAVWGNSGPSSATWNGKMFVYGGATFSGTAIGDGKYYRPDNNSWTSLNTTNTPSARTNFGMWFDGHYVGVWGGNNGSADLNTGAALSADNGSAWVATNTTGAPTARTTQATWTGKYAVFFGEDSGKQTYTFCGGTGITNTNRGARFYAGGGVLGGQWFATSTTSMPTCRDQAAIAWSGSKLFVWGGEESGGTHPVSGATYDPIYDVWTAISATNGATARHGASGIWTGLNFLVFFGTTSNTNPTYVGAINTGANYQR